MINWEKINSVDLVTISRIAKRTVETLKGGDMVTIEMDLAFTHLNCPLDLNKLLAFDLGDLYHDIAGISHHLNRRTGELKDCFLPRCAMPTKTLPPHVKAAGVQEYDSVTGSKWFLMDYQMHGNDFQEFVEEHNLEGNDSRGPGQYFSNHAYIKRTGHGRTLIVQSYGYDV